MCIYDTSNLVQQRRDLILIFQPNCCAYNKSDCHEHYYGCSTAYIYHKIALNLWQQIFISIFLHLIECIHVFVPWLVATQF